MIGLLNHISSFVEYRLSALLCALLFLACFSLAQYYSLTFNCTHFPATSPYPSTYFYFGYFEFSRFQNEPSRFSLNL
jgi:hypothetical protein